MSFIKRITGAIILLCLITSGYAQNGANYTFTTGTNASLLSDLNGNAIDMSTAPSALAADGTSANFPLDFACLLMGFRATKFGVTQNGLVTLGNNSLSASGNDAYTFIPAGNQAPTLAAYCASLRMAPGGYIRYTTIGVAPSRTFVVEFKGMTVFLTSTTGGTTEDATFQVRLYEGSGIVEFVYGSFQVTNLTAYHTSPSTGFASATNAFAAVHLVNQTVTTTGTYYRNPPPALGAEPILNSTIDGSRRYFRFVPPMPGEVSSMNISNITAQTMTVSWTPPADTSQFIAYALYKSPDGINYTYVNQFSKTQLGYNAYLGFNTHCYWKVTTIGEGRESAGTIASATTLNPVKAVQSGNWSDASVWSTGIVPDCTDDVFIMNGKTVNVNGIANAKNITVDTTAALAIAPGANLTSGCTGNNATVWNLGVLSMNGGTFNINGNLAFESKGRFFQSGGEIIIDGNDNGNLATSVPTGIPLLGFGKPSNLYNGFLTPANVYAVSLTGGKITIVDPHAAADSAFAVAVFLNSSFDAFDTAHTIQFGNGVSTDPAGSDGFNLKTFTGTTKCIVFGKARVDVGTAPNRMVKSIYANGDVELVSGTWQAGGGCFGGNVNINGGTLVSGGLGLCATKTSMIGYGGDNTLRLDQTIPQEVKVSNTGKIINTLTNPTANFSSLYIENSSASGVTFNTLNAIPGNISCDVSISSSMNLRGKFTMAPGSVVLFLKQDSLISDQVINFSAGLNYGFVPGITIARSYYNVGYRPGFAPGLNAPLPAQYSVFPFLNASGEQRTAWIDLTGPVTPGVYAVTYHEVPGTTPVSISDAASTVNTRSNSYFTFSTLGTNPTAASIAIALRGPNIIPGVVAPSYTHIVRANSAVGGYVLGSANPVYGIRNVLTVAELTGAPLYLGISGTQPVPVTLEYFKGNKQDKSNLLRWKTSAETNFSHFELQRSANGTDFNVLTTVEPHTPKGSEYTYVDETPFAARNFYRLNMVDLDGKSELSATVELSGDLKNNLKIEIGPVPVVQHLKIKIEGARSGNGVVRVMDVSGKTLHRMLIAADVAEADLDLSKLVSGVYTFEYTDGNNNYNRKITKL